MDKANRVAIERPAYAGMRIDAKEGIRVIDVALQCIAPGVPGMRLPSGPLPRPVRGPRGRSFTAN